MLPSATPLTLRSLLKTAAIRSGLSDAAQVLAGLSPPAQALAVTTLAATGKPVLIVLPRDVGVEQMTADARFFYASLSGASDSELARAVLSFPSPEIDPYRAVTPHLDVVSARARALRALAVGTARVVIASVAALLPRLSPPARFLKGSQDLVVGGFSSPTVLTELLADAGFTPEDPVDQRGEFCLRGGVVDFFPTGETYPVRVEFAGDMIESLRHYDPENQRSITRLDRVAVIPLRDTFSQGDAGGENPSQLVLDRSGTVFDYLNKCKMEIFVQEAEECERLVVKQIEQFEVSHQTALDKGESVSPPAELFIRWEDVKERLSSATRFETLTFDDSNQMGTSISCQPVVPFHGRLADWINEIRDGCAREETQLFVARTPGHANRVTELLEEYDLRAVSVEQADFTKGAALLVATGRLSQGFRLPVANLRIYTENDLFAEKRRDRQRSVAGSFLSNLRDLKVGDHVVHVDHGVGTFVGLTQMTVDATPHELMELRYAGGDKLFVPVEHLDLIQKYTGSQKAVANRLGGTTWERAKTRVKRAMRDMAQELLGLYARREAITGHGFAPDTHWQEEFESAFEYELTPDQKTAVADIKQDMEALSPMDRLLCGDVGYGKTEVALRAAFKAVMDGKQVAFLAPTTVLAFQHFKTASERFAAFPIRIEMVSRLRSRSNQKDLLDHLVAGKIEMIIGTHRLLSKDVRFQDLGLLIVDEEQRFGVAHKERIKRLRENVDVLTLTATPIPRTLNMSLMGIRDISVIETPPKDRLSIQTNVVKFDTTVLARAIRTELERGGQVYVVHNRIETIYTVADMIQQLVPEAQLAVAHGQSTESDLERVMLDFMSHKYDVLLSTTIIENGLDIPNVNTIIVNHAERFGLSQLYQLRGRVGRSDRRAYAYLLTPTEDGLSQVARQRLAAIKEFSDLGSGFRVAALDLEIRGAGNLLGAQQSGHIEAIGFDMYIKLLEQTVRELKGEIVEDDHRAAINLGLDLRIDEKYIPETNQRLALYRKVAEARDDQALSAVLDESMDRYGPVPPSVIRLAEYGRIRVLADRLGLESVEREQHLLVIRFRDNTKIEPDRLISFVQDRPAVTLTPPAVIRVDLGVFRRSDDVPPRRTVTTRSASWWTKRARFGHATKGFSRNEILEGSRKGETENLLAEVNELLSDLSGPTLKD